MIFGKNTSARYLWSSLLAFLATLPLLYGVYVHGNAEQNSGKASIGVLDSRLENLENTVLLQEKRIKDLETKQQLQTTQTVSSPASASTANPPSQPADLPPAVNASASDMQDRLTELEKQITALKSNAPLEDKDKLYHSIRLLSAFHRLSAKVLSGKPFATELSAFEDIVGDDKAFEKPLAVLSPYAGGGIPTFAALLGSFDDASESLKSDEAIPPVNASAWQRMMYNITHLITVRRIDREQTGNSTNAILGRAEAHLDAQEIDEAITEIKSLPDDVRGNFANWLEDAQTAAGAAETMSEIEEDVMQKAFYTQGTANDPPSETTPATSPDNLPAKNE